MRPELRLSPIIVYILGTRPENLIRMLLFVSRCRGRAATQLGVKLVEATWESAMLLLHCYQEQYSHACYSSFSMANRNEKFNGDAVSNKNEDSARMRRLNAPLMPVYGPASAPPASVVHWQFSATLGCQEIRLQNKMTITEISGLCDNEARRRNERVQSRGCTGHVHRYSMLRGVIAGALIPPLTCTVSQQHFQGG